MATGAARPVVTFSPALQRLAALPILTVIATKREDGSIQLNPIWFELRDGLVVVNSNTKRAWPRNLQRQKEATFLLVDPDKAAERYAQIHGRLVAVTPDPNVEVINRLSRRYTGKPFRELEPGEERITFTIEPVRVTGQMI
ncbi:MAG: PPOX class F420-dependent oxidoreductase [Chloroflexi bacterium]|nr:MAG: PPOX class F420-dependent oxidoreductase [Chloroflexota bacterium]